MAQQQAVRDYLKSRGLKDEEIGYDNGTVLAKGKRFIDATPNADGRTYADSRQLDNAYSDYDTKDQIAQLRTRATQPNAELTSMQQAIRDRINKPVQQFSYDQNSDPQYQNAIKQANQNAQTAGNNAMVSLGARGIGNSSITSDRVSQIQQKELGNVTTNILPQLIAQKYQQFRDQQQSENQQTGNMMQYADYLDRSGQQQFRNSFDLLGQQNTMNQQDITNDRNVQQDQRQKRLDNTAVQQWYQQQFGVPIEAKDDWSLMADQVKGLTPLAMQQYLQQKAAQEAGFTGQYNGQDTMDAKKMAAEIANQQAQLAISRMNAGTSAASAANSAGNASFNRLMDVWKATGKAPAGLEGMGIQAGTAFSDGKANTQLDKEMQGLFTGLSTGKIDPAKAMDEIKLQLSAGMYTPSEAASMMNLVQQYSNSAPQQAMPQLSPSQVQAIEAGGGKNFQSMGQSQLEQEWASDPTGKAAGTPIMDWSAWARDPRGRSAGVSFGAYQQAYGARIGK